MRWYEWLAAAVLVASWWWIVVVGLSRGRKGEGR